RDGGNVLQATGGDRQATAVDQHQGAVGAEVAQVNVGATDGFTGRQRLRAADRRRTGGGEVLQDVANRGEALVLDGVAADGENRLRGLDVGLADARARDLDAVQGRRLLAAGVLGERNARAGDGGCARNEREGNRVAELGGLQSHLSLQVSLGKFPWEPAGGDNADAKFGKAGADTSPLAREIKVSLTNRAGCDKPAWKQRICQRSCS